VASEAVGAYSNQCQSSIRRPGSLSFFFLFFSMSVDSIPLQP
jgi:hypothetical protein